jgi:hypothetical protein
MTTKTHDIHFGIYPNLAGKVSVSGHKDPTEEVNLILPPALEAAGMEAYVSGSFKCWGPADQATDGDHSLHVLVRTPNLGGSDDIAWLAQIFEALTTLPRTHGRWLDYAIISQSDDWSEQPYLAFFRPNISLTRLTTEFEVTA